MPGMLLQGRPYKQLRAVHNQCRTQERKKMSGKAKVTTVAVSPTCGGYGGRPKTVEVNILPSGIGMHVNGIGARATKEIMLRVTSAMNASGYSLPGTETVITLSPPPENSRGILYYCLPIALALIKASGQEKLSIPSRKKICGVLSPEGEIEEPLAEQLRHGRTLKECIEEFKTK